MFGNDRAMAEAERPGTSDPILARLRGAGRAAEVAFLAERDRWVLWLPVLLGAGIALYFWLPVEPPRWPALAWILAAAVLAWRGRARPSWLLLGLGLGAAGVGFAAATWRTDSVSAPVLAQRLGPVEVIGRVALAARADPGFRLTLEGIRIAGLAAERTPERVRVRLRSRSERPRPGDWIRMRTVLMPPPGPAAPGAFDFARRAYFQGVGAVGYAVSRPKTAAPPARESDPGGGFRRWLAGLRQTIAERVLRRLDGAAGAVAAALMTGMRGAIPAEVLAALRDAGLAHLLAISGLHLGLVTAVLFFAIRAGLALVEPLALRYPIKKWAAACALAGAFAYLLLAGATVPTRRAFLMTALVLVAILLDREAVSMRLVAWAAAAVLLLAPESLLGASFQLSFAAVIALIAVYELCRDWFTAERARMGRPGRILLYLAGVGLTTLTAGLATAPFVIFHFNRLASFSLAANLIAIPLMAFWIMPWVVAAFVLMPLGLESIALMPMGWGIEAVIAVASRVSSWPGAVSLWPAMPGGGLAAIALGGLWLCLWQGRWRLLGLPALVGGLATLAFVQVPDLLVDGRGRLFAVRADAGGLMLSTTRRERRTGELWLRRAGQRNSLPWPGEAGATPAGGPLTCDPLGCILKREGTVVALIQDPRALADDCRAVDLVVSLVPARRRSCPRSIPVIDRFDLWRRGAHAIWLGEGRPRIESVADHLGRRPWTPDRRRR